MTFHILLQYFEPLYRLRHTLLISENYFAKLDLKRIRVEWRECNVFLYSLCSPEYSIFL